MDLKIVHTEKLLEWLQQTRKLQVETLNFDISGQVIPVSQLPVTKVFYFTSVQELREELALRPHIPNKKERRKIRQDKAKNKKNRQ